MLSEAEDVGTRLMRIARFRTRDWAGHTEYEDMLATAYLLAWSGYQRATGRGMRYPFQIAALAAQHAPAEWLRSWFGRTDRGEARAGFELVPLLEADWIEHPSPEAEVLARLERAEAWLLLERGALHCTKRQRAVLYRLFVLDETPGEAATQLGICHQVISKVRDRALAHCRGRVKIRRTGRMEKWETCRKGHRLEGHNRLVVNRSDRPAAVRCRACQNESRRRCRQRWREEAAAGRESASGPGDGS